VEGKRERKERGGIKLQGLLRRAPLEAATAEVARCERREGEGGGKGTRKEGEGELETTRDDLRTLRTREARGEKRASARALTS